MRIDVKQEPVLWYRVLLALSIDQSRPEIVA